MNAQEILDNVQIGISPFTGEVYIGIPEEYGIWKVKSNFTERLCEFAPQLFKDDAE